MYDFIRGHIRETTNEYTVLENQGIGYKIFTPKNTIAHCTKDASILLYVEAIYREDAHTLYGFLDRKDREFFRMLLLVNGIGPKIALAILSAGNTGEIAEKIFQKNSKLLSCLPGIGKKLAERLIVELSEKVSPFCIAPSSTSFTICCDSKPSSSAEEALVTLGFSRNEASTIIHHVIAQYPDLTSVETIVQQALLLKRTLKI